MGRSLVLNATLQPLAVVPARRAVVLVLKEKADIVQFAARFYPEARTSGALALAVDDLWNEYSRRLERPDHEPPQYLGRSGPEG